VRKTGYWKNEDYSLEKIEPGTRRFRGGKRFLHLEKVKGKGCDGKSLI